MMYLTYTICSHYHDTTKVAFCVPNLYLNLSYTICCLSSIMKIGAYCVGKVTICHLSSIMIFGAYCVGRVHNTLPQLYYDKGVILCR